VADNAKRVADQVTQDNGMRRALARARRGAALDIAEAEILLQAAGADLEALCAIAARVRDAGLEAAGRPGVITYSKKVFIPLTRLCRDKCHYCTFVTVPGKLRREGQGMFLSPDEVLDIARKGAVLGCKEALFTLGDKPEERWPEAREWLDAHGYDDTLAYVRAMAIRVLEETGLLPHLNPGVLSWTDLQRLKPVAPSMGMMLETVATRLWSEPGGPHHGSPDKDPAVRLRVLEDAGRSSVPFTTGLLIGIGETYAERAEGLFAIRRVARQYQGIQEVIVQNFRAKPDTAMRGMPDAELHELAAAVAVARLILGPAARIQAPPNLVDHEYALLIGAGIDDWGGVSPLTPDHVNPERPWPHIEELAARTAASGFQLRERLTVYPEYLRRGEPWLDPRLLPHVRALADPETGLADEDAVPGGLPWQETDALVDSGRTDLHASIDTAGRTGDRRADFDEVYGDWNELRAQVARGFAGGNAVSNAAGHTGGDADRYAAGYAGGDADRYAASYAGGDADLYAGGDADLYAGGDADLYAAGCAGGDADLYAGGYAGALAAPAGLDAAVARDSSAAHAVPSRLDAAVAPDSPDNSPLGHAVPSRLDADLRSALDVAAADPTKLTDAQALALFTADGPALDELCRIADDVRRDTVGDDVTYLVTRNINFTNVCYTGCRFCAFAQRRTDADAYTLSLDQVADRAEQAWQVGATEVCMQGGIHPDLPGTAYFDIARAVKERVPGMHVHAFSPMEVVNGATRTGMSIRDWLAAAKEAGLDTIPGTAAEILDDEVRWILTKGKLPAATWIEVIRTAHELGIRSSSTMMYGHVDEPRHWLGHLRLLADMQRTNLENGHEGFTEFVTLPFIHTNAPVYLAGISRPGPTMRDNRAVTAMARLLLHPVIPNIQTSWVKLGPDGSAEMLRSGANDLGGTLMEETISRMAGSSYGSYESIRGLEAIAAAAGRPARQRTTTYGDVSAERIAVGREFDGHLPELLPVLEA
jgi:FO synthase